MRQLVMETFQPCSSTVLNNHSLFLSRHLLNNSFRSQLHRGYMYLPCRLQVKDSSLKVTQLPSLHIPGEGSLPVSEVKSLAPSVLPSLQTPGEGSLPVSDTTKNLAPFVLPSLKTPGEGCIQPRQSVGDMTFGSSLSSAQTPRE